MLVLGHGSVMFVFWASFFGRGFKALHLAFPGQEVRGDFGHPASTIMTPLSPMSTCPPLLAPWYPLIDIDSSSCDNESMLIEQVGLPI